MRPLRALSASLSLIAAVLVPLSAQAAPALAKVGDPPVVIGNGIQRSLVAVTLPDVKFLRQDGQNLNLRQALDDGRPVLLNFTFTSCSAICPVSAQVFAQVREKLGADRDKLHLVSVSIDAAFDTVPRLREYVAKLGSGNNWSFFTGQEADSISVQKAFGAYRGDKMNHVPVSYLRAAPGQPWIRLDGLIGPDQLLGEVKAVLAAPRSAAPAVPATKG
ncbi:MAG: SCO family protein [Leptothrix sp. (in: b-proteobacteria)]